MLRAVVGKDFLVIGYFLVQVRDFGKITVTWNFQPFRNFCHQWDFAGFHHPISICHPANWPDMAGPTLSGIRFSLLIWVNYSNSVEFTRDSTATIVFCLPKQVTDILIVTTILFTILLIIISLLGAFFWFVINIVLWGIKWEVREGWSPPCW